MSPTETMQPVTFEYRWAYDSETVDWAELSELYRVAPLGEKAPVDLATVFANSRFRCFLYAGDRLVGAGRVLADGLDVAYLADVAIHPAHQGTGLGSALVQRLVELSSGHKKIILYANPGTERFYARLGFHRMNTALAIWKEPEPAIATGVISPMT